MMYLTSNQQDIIFINWFVQGACVLSDYFWFAYLSIPGNFMSTTNHQRILSCQVGDGTGYVIWKYWPMIRNFCKSKPPVEVIDFISHMLISLNSHWCCH
jgi:hypothetical protein